jgi:hypothetical protein
VAEAGVGQDHRGIGALGAILTSVSIPDLRFDKRRLPDCRHLDANAWLEGHPGGAPFVRVELFCGLTGDPLPSLLHCACCQKRLLKSASLSRSALAPMLTG